VPDEQRILLSNLPADRRQKKTAFCVALVSFVGFAVVVFFASVPLPWSSGFIVAVAAITFVVDLITASLLFAQFSIFGSRAMAALASGYLLTGLLMVPYSLTFPGAFSQSGLLGADLDSPVWLFLIWHAAPPITVIVYILLKDAGPIIPTTPKSLRRVIIRCIVATIAAASGLAWFAIAQHNALPPLQDDITRGGALWHRLIPLAPTLNAVALAMLWQRRGSVLDLWLLVQSWSWLLESLLLNFVEARFDVGYYAARIFCVLSSSLVLLVLISQLAMLNMRVVLSTMAQRRSREERFATLDAFSASVAHQLRQPLAAIAAESQAGFNWLKRLPPNAEEARSCLEGIMGAARGANDAIEAVRAMFRSDTALKDERFDLNDLVREMISLLHRELEALQILVQFELDPGVPAVRGNRAQLGQVVLNLVKNAADSMSLVSDRARILSVATRRHEAEEVVVAVTDSGVGIDPKTAARIFEGFYTSKPDGMGMGLAICRSIVEAHGGRLWTAPRLVGPGAVFEFSLPLASQEIS
jgi:signal transduction histidine kinase